MQRYFLTELNHEITGQDAHHIINVMRMRSGEEVIICSKGRCFLVELNIQENRVFYKEKKELIKEKELDVTLVQGLPKHPKAEIVTKNATLFGASHITFVPMIRSISKPDNEANKLKRMNLIAKEAAELAHRFDIPDISFSKSIKSIDWSQYDIIVLADENEKTKTLPDALFDVKDINHIVVVIGPEGGITDQERNYFESIGAINVSLGKNILPTELASIYALTYFSLKKS